MWTLGLFAAVLYKTIKDNAGSTTAVSDSLPAKKSPTDHANEIVQSKNDDFSKDVIKITLKK